MKFRPLTWKTTHSYLVVDRYEDITDAETKRLNPKADRKILLYGYLRGTNLKQNMKVHIPGCGDFFMNSLTNLPDPCPLPEKTEKAKKYLNEKQKLLYAPMSDVGGIIYDKDAVYITIPEHQVAFTKREGDNDQVEGTGEKLVKKNFKILQ